MKLTRNPGSGSLTSACTQNLVFAGIVGLKLAERWDEVPLTVTWHSMVKKVAKDPRRITLVTRLAAASALPCGFFLFSSVLAEGLKTPAEFAQPCESWRAAKPPMAARCCSKVFPILDAKRFQKSMPSRGQHFFLILQTNHTCIKMTAHLLDIN